MAVFRNDDGEARTKTLGVLVAVMVVAGVVALVMTVFGGSSNGSQAAAQPSGSQVGNQSSSTPSVTSSAAAASSSPVARATTSPSARRAAPKPTKTKASTGTSSEKVVYTVKRGDNLTDIASWFNQRGYGTLYDWNKSVIGKNPDLIFAGQKIVVSLTGDHMKVSTATK